MVLTIIFFFCQLRINQKLENRIENIEERIELLNMIEKNQIKIDSALENRILKLEI